MFVNSGGVCAPDTARITDTPLAFVFANSPIVHPIDLAVARPASTSGTNSKVNMH
jgi:hypothetical protein